MAPTVGRRILALRYIRDAALAPVVIGSATYYLALRLNLPYKPLLVLCSIVVGWPVKFSIWIRYESWRRTRRAHAIGAVAASESRGRSFGDIDIVQELQKTNRGGFIGEYLSLYRDVVGHSKSCAYHVYEIIRTHRRMGRCST